MNASSWSLRNLPWFRATLAQWRYALRNTIAMCLALTVAYYLNLDEPYWAMTSAAVVSFPTVGGVISKSLGRIAGSLLGAIAALLLAGHTLNEPWFFLLSMSAWLGFCTWACAHFTNNVAYAFQLAGYTAAIIAFPMTFFAHRGLTRFVLSGKNPGEDITEVVEEHFGVGAGKLITNV